MALVTTTTQGTTSQDCTTLVIGDTTGAYNVSTNPTGYGAPNYAVSAVVELVFDAIIPNTSEYTDPYVLTGSDAEDIMNQVSDLNITSQVLDYTATTNSPLQEVDYYCLYTPYWFS